MMEKHQKQIILNNCNDLMIEEIEKIIESGDITINEFEQAGLEQSKIKILLQRKESKLKSQSENDYKTELLNQILQKKLNAQEIKDHISKKTFSWDDMRNVGVPEKTIKSLRHFSEPRLTIFKKLSDLPPMEEGRTDIYFIGVPGSGKSTMLAGILRSADKDGILMTDVYNNDGSVYQNTLISDLKRGLLPNATAHGSYNYVAASILDEDKSKHPFNIVEVPGENYINMYQNGDVKEFLRYVSNRNKKILVFVIDSLSHETGYTGSVNQADQSLVYVNILKMFETNGILEQTDAIYLVVNKYDALKNERYGNRNDEDVELAFEFLREEFKNLISNCQNSRSQTKNRFNIKVMPFSIGSVSYTHLLDSYEPEFSKIILENLLADSFINRGRKLKHFN